MCLSYVENKYHVQIYCMTIFVAEAGYKGRVKELHPTDTVRCNNLSLSWIPVSAEKVIMCPVYYQWTYTKFAISSDIHINVFVWW